MSYDNPFATAQVAEVKQPDPNAGPPPTEKQLQFAQRLAAERGIEMPEGMTKATISTFIDETMKLPKITKPEPPEGFHEFEGKVYKVQVAHHGSGNKYAKVLDTEHGGFDYVGRSHPFHSLSEDTLLTLERAKELGHLYGMCCVCGATLTDERSITAGIGPVCASKF